jgi:hypothetical protein
MNDVPFNASDVLRAKLAGDTPDLPDRNRSRLALMQSTSPELVLNHRRYAGNDVAASDFVASWVDGETTVYKHGVVCRLVGFDLRYNEFHLDRGAERGKLIKSHSEEPSDAKWLKVGAYGKEGSYRIGADGRPYSRVVKTLYAYLLIGNRGAVYAFYGTALQDGYDFANKANRLRVRTVDGEPLRGYCLAKWRFTARPAERGGRHYFRPTVELVAKLGEPGGPSIEEVLADNAVRQAFLQGLNWEPEQIEDHSARDWTPPAPEPANDQFDERNPPPGDEDDHGEPWSDEIPS